MFLCMTGNITSLDPSIVLHGVHLLIHPHGQAGLRRASGYGDGKGGFTYPSPFLTQAQVLSNYESDPSMSAREQDQFLDPQSTCVFSDIVVSSLI